METSDEIDRATIAICDGKPLLGRWSYLRSYAKACLCQLAARNPSVSVDKPLAPVTLYDSGTLAQRASKRQETVHPTCHLIHPGECG